MFASKTVLEHLARGVVGLGAFAAAFVLMPLHPWLALAALPVGFLSLRGCPSCWLVGLAQTIAPRLSGRGNCVDGSCTRRPSV